MGDAERREELRASPEDPGDAAAVLRRRLRAGELSEAAVELCAYLGHGPARVALGRPYPAGEHVPVWDWVEEAPNRGVWLALLRSKALYWIRHLDAEALAAHPERRLLPEDADALRSAFHEITAWTQAPVESPQFSEVLAEGSTLSVGVIDGLADLQALARDLPEGPLDLDDERSGEFHGVLGEWTWSDEVGMHRSPLPELAEGVIPALLGTRFERGDDAPSAALDYLRWRLEVGLLPERRLRIAALCGSELAQELCEQRPLEGVEWLRALVSLEDVTELHFGWTNRRLLSAAARVFGLFDLAEQEQFRRALWRASWLRGKPQPRAVERYREESARLREFLDRIESDSGSVLGGLLVSVSRACLEGAPKPVLEEIWLQIYEELPTGERLRLEQDKKMLIERSLSP